MKWWWRLKIHPTWMFTSGLVGIVFGLALSPQSWSVWFEGWMWYVVASLLFAVSLRWPRRILLVSAVLGGLAIGLARGSGDVEQRTSYAPLVGTRVQLVGKVSEDPDVDKVGATVLRLEDLTDHGRAVPGMIWVTLTAKNTIQRSDSVTVQGELGAGFGNFNASIYRAKLVAVERPSPGDVALAVRDDFARHVRMGIGEPAASLGLGYLTGQRRALPPELDTALKVAGLTHIVVASGYNLTILVRLVRRLFARRSRYLVMYFSVMLVLGFMMVTGQSPSMVRAAFVSLISLLAWYFGRKFHPVTLLAFAAAVTGLYEPSYVWGNLGWQLSFASFTGVMILAPLLQRYFFGDSKPSLVRQIVGETISAQIMAAPLILYAFGQISNVALISNVLILPLVPLAMLLTFITGTVGYLVPALVQMIGLPAQWLLDYMVWVAEKTASISWAQTQATVLFAGLVLAFVGIASACWYLQRVTGYRLADGNIVE